MSKAKYNGWNEGSAGGGADSTGAQPWLTKLAEGSQLWGGGDDIKHGAVEGFWMPFVVVMR